MPTGVHLMINSVYRKGIKRQTKKRSERAAKLGNERVKEKIQSKSECNDHNEIPPLLVMANDQ
jgi:hypothetical protein